MMMWRNALVLAALAAAAPAQAGAPATLAVTGVDRSQPGVVRIAVRYDGSRKPSFRLMPTCAGSGERHDRPARACKWMRTLLSSHVARPFVLA